VKLAFACAVAMKADILLLYEAITHLDKRNAAWMENCLTSVTQVTSMIVCQDSGFLDRVCRKTIHYQPNLKLKSYVGNLSEFAKRRPEVKACYVALGQHRWSVNESFLLNELALLYASVLLCSTRRM
jgi:elongation factor 3